MTLSIRMVRTIALAGLCALLLFFTTITPSQAQSSVRPPDDAVTLQTEPGPSNTNGSRSVSEIWRDIRHGTVGTASSDTAGAVMVQSLGQDWRLFRETYLLKYAGWFPVGVIGILVLVFLIRGRMPIKGGRSGRVLPRFTLNQRVAHWFLASVFILLALSGLIILLGRPVIVPLLGHEVNSVLVSAALQGHNLFGPLFILGLLWMFVKFVGANFFRLIDFQWIFKLGGLLGGHVSSGLFNFGEKSWFWLLMLIGAVMSSTGLALEFPWAIAELWQLQAATVLHAIGAIILICVALGHIYMGSVGIEGALDSMLKGEVDENWAKEHHDHWYQDVTGNDAKPDSKAETAP